MSDTVCNHKGTLWKISDVNIWKWSLAGITLIFLDKMLTLFFSSSSNLMILSGSLFYARRVDSLHHLFATRLKTYCLRHSSASILGKGGELKKQTAQVIDCNVWFIYLFICFWHLPTLAKKFFALLVEVNSNK